jgi:hypothetical protein
MTNKLQMDSPASNRFWDEQRREYNSTKVLDKMQRVIYYDVRGGNTMTNLERELLDALRLFCDVNPNTLSIDEICRRHDVARALINKIQRDENQMSAFRRNA